MGKPMEPHCLAQARKGMRWPLLDSEWGGSFSRSMHFPGTGALPPRAYWESLWGGGGVETAPLLTL